MCGKIDYIWHIKQQDNTNNNFKYICDYEC